jgi:hypothetical protein
MAYEDSIPTQVRAVDPFASYNSNTVNKLTRMLTYGQGNDGLSKRTSCDVISLGSSGGYPGIYEAVISPGEVYKDDVWISITEEHTVDFLDQDQYYNTSTGFFNQEGYYYIVLEYEYQKQRPAPEARIIIVQPDQRGTYSPGNNWIFLKAVLVRWHPLVFGGWFTIDSVYSYDPENTNNKRLYVPKYAGTEVFLPTFDTERDPARIVYVESEDEYYFGYSDRWSGAGGGGGSVYDADTTGFQLGDLVYINNVGDIAKANASLGITTADGVVSVVGTSGRIQMSGRVPDVKVETGQTVSVGNLVYLSKTQSGTVSTEKSTPFHQFVGRCIEVQDSTTITILFVRGEPGGGTGIADLATYVYDFIDSTSWIASGANYYVNIDTSDFADGHAVIQLWDADTNETVIPYRMDCLSGTTRVFMPVNTKNLYFMAIGPTDTTRLSSNVTDVTATLLPGGWLGGGPFYQDVDVSSIENRGAGVLVKDANTDGVIEPSDVVFDSTGILRIYMPTNTETLEVVAMGPTSIPGGTNLIGLNLTLPSGVSWIPSGSLYYQDISLSTFGDNEIIMSFVDADTMQYIYPTAVVFIDGGTTARIVMTDDTHNVNVTIIG